MEQQAINWLSKAHVEGDDGLDAEYHAKDGDPKKLQKEPGKAPVTIRAALNYLIDNIQKFNLNSRIL